MVMNGESFGYVVNPHRQPAQRQYLDEKLLFLDPTTEVLLSIVYPIMASFFTLLGSLMIRRLKQFNQRYKINENKMQRRTLIRSIKNATIILSVPMILVGLRFFLEIVLHDSLAYACNYILTGDKKSYQFVSYWFCSIVFTEYACYGAIILTVYIRKKRDWDKLLRLPLKLPKS